MGRPELLTLDERETIADLGQIATRISQKIIGHGPTRDHDVAEMVHHIHILQQLVMAQAASRAYPELYRLLGETSRLDVRKC